VIDGERLRELGRATAEASRHGASLGGRYRSGDLFLHPEACEGGVRWVVLAGGEDEVWVMACDLSPLVGSADVAVPVGEGGGPLTLRGAFDLRISPRVLAPEWRVGTLARARVERARAVAEGLAAGTHRGSALAREVDEDPEYEDWLAEVVAPAREALRSAPAIVVPEAPSVASARAFFPWSRALAATFAATTVGLLFWAGALKQQADRYSGVILSSQSVEIAFDDVSRGPGPPGEPLVVSRGMDLLFITFVLPVEEPPLKRLHFEILDERGAVLESATENLPPPGEDLVQHTVRLEPGLLAPGLYRVRLNGQTEGGERPLEKLLGEKLLRIIE